MVSWRVVTLQILSVLSQKDQPVTKKHPGLPCSPARMLPLLAVIRKVLRAGAWKRSIIYLQQQDPLKKEGLVWGGGGWGGVFFFLS